MAVTTAATPQGQQQQQPGPAKRSWLPRWLQGKQRTNAGQGSAEDVNGFYSQAMEWTHKADKVISLALGYLLAIASVLGFMDVLSNGQVLGAIPWAFYVWLAIMGLGVDFQLLLVIGRFPDLIQAVHSAILKFVFILFNLAFLAFLAYMSATIAAVFTQHVDAGGQSTVIDAMSALGIDAHTFVYERAWLATLLLVLMAVDRTLERWRMRQAQSTQQKQANNAVQAQPGPMQQTDMEKLIEAMQQMNTQTLQAVQAMNQQAMQVTIEQATRVTVEAVKQSLEALPFTQPFQIAGPATGPVASVSITENATQAQAAPFLKDYRAEIEQLLASNPSISPEEVIAQTGCSKPTAIKWLSKLQPATVQNAT